MALAADRRAFRGNARVLHRASDRPTIPYLGAPEDRVLAAFLNAYGNVRARMRTTSWADGLRDAIEAGADAAMEYVRLTLSSAAAGFREGILPVYFQIVAAQGDGMVQKAEAQRQSTQPLVRPRRRKVVPLLDQPSGVSIASQHHIAAAQSMAMDLITNITNAQEAVVREIVTESITKGIDVLVTGDRIADVVGLFPRWQRAVENFRARQFASGARPDIAARRTARYADNLLRKRGVMIARTELMRAMNLGRLTQWRQMDEEGRLDGEQSVKRLIVSPGACDGCLRAPKEVQGIEGWFETEFGDFDHPPFHPHCRCTMSLVAIAGPKGLSGQNE